MKHKTIKALVLAVALMVPSTTAQARTYVDDSTPIEIQISCNKWGEVYNICPELLEAICYHESRFNESVTDSTGSCVGLMQIKASCHKGRMIELGATDLKDIDDNIHVGADYLAELFADYEDVGIVLGLYHGESNAVERAKRGQLSDYVTEILEMSYELEEQHGKHNY